MASSEVWTDFEQIRHNIKNNTVDKLKQIITGINDECYTNFSKSGKKQDIIDRIVGALDSWRNLLMEDKWMKAKVIINQVRNIGSYTPAPRPSLSVSAPATQLHGHHASSTFKQPTYPYLNGSSTSTLSRYDPYAPPRKPQPPAAGLASTSSTSTSSRPIGIRFRDSPFFRIDQAVSSIVECPESTSAMDRRQQTLTFTLNNEQVSKLKQPGSNYQLRLFCTSSIFYTSNSSVNFRSSNLPCPIEFPPTCEVRVNNVQLTANLKGLKKKPGTAPPPDLGKYLRWTTTQNRIEMVYVNSTQPVQSKKFYLVVMLVETTSIERLIEDLNKNCRRSSQEIRQKMVESLSDDDDIQAGPQKMSLKCPLSFTRVTTPCRSLKCVHSQCFDATSWFYMMEQTTTYLCPTCEHTLDYKDLMIDGYFDEILKTTPESVEDVIVEADGEWHTSDNKYGSPQWKETHPVQSKPASPVKPASQTPKPPPTPNGTNEGKGKAKAADVVFVLDDSDDSDDDEVKQEQSPSYYRSFDEAQFPPPTQTQSQSQRDGAGGAVIDLTLSDDENDSPPPRPKRTATEAELPEFHPVETWKKARTAEAHDHHQLHQPHTLPLPTFLGTNGGVDIHSHTFDHSNPQPAPVPPLAINGYIPQGIRTPAYNNYPGRQGLTDSRQLPPPPQLSYPPVRSNPASRWPGP